MMKGCLKTIGKRIIQPVPLSFYRLLVKKEVMGFVYHTVSDEPLFHVKHLFPYKTPQMFEADLIHLKKNFNLMSSSELLEYRSSKTKFGPHSTILTFDDGYSECFSVARPLLLKHEIPCVFFITTDFIDNQKMYYRNKISLCIEKISTSANPEILGFFSDINDVFGLSINSPESFIQWIKTLNHSSEDIIDEICKILRINIKQYMMAHKPYMSSEEIKLLSSDGFTIGAHSKTHRKLYLLPNQEEIEEEIVSSCKEIMELTGEDRVPFAFPVSREDIDHDFLKSLISKYPFIHLFYDSGGLKKEKDFVINRVPIDDPSLVLPGKSNIPVILRDAYQGYLMNKIRNMLRS